MIEVSSVTSATNDRNMAVGMSAGIAALAVAILAWGSAFVPTKSPSMALTPPHIVVYQVSVVNLRKGCVKRCT
jgi:hypothetical protein